MLSAAATAASSLLDFDLAARLQRAAEESGDGGQARVHLAYNLLMSQKGEDAAAAIESIAPDEVPEWAFINDVVLHAANPLWTMRSPEESWAVIDEALRTATGPRRGQLLAFRANQLVLAARPAEVVEMIDTVDYGQLDGYGQSVKLCAEALALAEVGRTAEAVATAMSRYQVIGSSQQGNFLSQALVEFHSFGLSIAGRIPEAVELAETHRDDCVTSPSTAKAWRPRSPGLWRWPQAICAPRCGSCRPRAPPTTPTWCWRTASTAFICGATSPALAAARLHIPLPRREHEIAAFVAEGSPIAISHRRFRYRCAPSRATSTGPAARLGSPGARSWGASSANSSIWRLPGAAIVRN